MAEFLMPSLGADMDHGTLIEWLISPGDAVHRGDIVAVVDTEKAAMDIESFEDCVVDRLLVEPGTTVRVGAPLAVFATTSRPRMVPAPAVAPAPVPVAPVPVAPVPVAPVPVAPAAVPTPVSAPIASESRAAPPIRHLAHRLGIDLAGLSGSGPDGRITRADVEAATRATGAPSDRRAMTSPYARRLAADLGVDVGSLTGTGRAGAVIADDVRRAAAVAATPEPSRPPTSALRDHAAGMRQAIAALMARSKREIPHYYLRTTIDLSTATTHLAALNAGRPVTGRLVPAVLLLKAAAVAARTVPQLNGWWVDDAFAPADHVHLGVAVALREGGLIAPAIHDADALDLDALMAALKDLVARVRRGRLRGSEMRDATLTVTNLGDRGVEEVYGVIYPPQVALVGFGKVIDRPWAVDGMLTVRPVVTVTLSADHRATDGHVGGRYLAAIEDLLQRPEEL
jgi:pyruvate dehydrogenase E2 component (dihydrolipoamide acetyltransferase)